MNVFKFIKAVMFVALIFPSITAMAITPDEIVSNTASKIRNAKGVDCSFTATFGGKSVTGQLKSSGDKFNIVTEAGSSWYNGKALYTYNPSSSETTVFTPTKGELAEVNPLCYVSDVKGSYTVSMATRQPKTGYCVELIPLKRKSPVKNVKVTVSSSFVPQQVSITASDGSVSVIDIKSVNYTAAHPASTFEYPKSRYSKAQIVDLR